MITTKKLLKIDSSSYYKKNIKLIKKKVKEIKKVKRQVRPRQNVSMTG